jgi:N-acetylglucosamine-6-sulfatase
MLAWAPGRIPAGTVVSQLVQNIDVAPTLLDAAGVVPPHGSPAMDGRSFLPLLAGRPVPWRDHILYEYHWEWNFPATPTIFAIRTMRDKYVYHHGIWDRDGYYDLALDPAERHNLIDVPACRDRITALREQLFDALEAGGGAVLPIARPRGERLGERKLPR